MISFRKILSKLDNLTPLLEDKGHLDHPEDMIFLGGSSGASNAIDSIVNTVKSPKAITIKWDGYPALIFGRNSRGQFSIMDKHMFNKKDGTGRLVFSPKQFVEYDNTRGVSRPELHQIIAEIWTGLEKADNTKGYYWGDLLFTKPLKVQTDGLYHFRANPNGITYTVDPKSDIGKELTGKQAAIVVHQFIPATAASTNDATPLNGTIGTLKNNSNVAIVPAKMPITPSLQLDNSLIRNAETAIKKYGPAVDKMLSSTPQAASAFVNLFTVYINRRIVSRNLNDLYKGFMEFFESRPMTQSMKEKLTKHFQENQEGLLGAFTIWAELYKLKMSVVNQLNKAAESAPVQGYLQDGTKTQEGFVSQGLKFVDRMGFSAQNLAART